MSIQETTTTLDASRASGGWFSQTGNVYALVIIGLVALGSMFALGLDQRFVYLLVYVWFGLIYGVLLQYGRFCMASAVRDLFAVGVPRMAVGVMIAVVLFSLTAAAVQVTGFNTFHPHPLGWHILIGGLFLLFLNGLLVWPFVTKRNKA